MKKNKTSSFVLTLPLSPELWQKEQLDKLFRVSCNLYNNLTADRIKALHQMERTKNGAKYKVRYRRSTTEKIIKKSVMMSLKHLSLLGFSSGKIFSTLLD